MHHRRSKIVISGQVQGVGFRPHVFRTAQKLALSGWVYNTASGVTIEIQGEKVEDFLPELFSKLPVLAQIEQVQTEWIPSCAHEHEFQIKESHFGPIKTTIVPDTGICAACLHELFQTDNRYYGYAFLNCTHCGPRFTITRQLPYDRDQTSMDVFPLCTQCYGDYQNPMDRRYHAQPTACQRCGPQLMQENKVIDIELISQIILQGGIIALKGLGGYQIICDARNIATIQRLRTLKNRPTKPLALMVLNGSSAHSIVMLDSLSQTLLESRERPIVVLPKHAQALNANIAPGLSHFGLMLPYTPLHYLLFHALLGKPAGQAWLDQSCPIPLVVTSANLGGEPLIYEDEIAYKQLPTMVDHVFSYNRHIICRADDSVMQIIDKAPRFIRRARGFVPMKIKLPHAIQPTLALGCDLKNTFCITQGKDAFVSQHIGSLHNKETIEFFHHSLEHFLRFLDIQPVCIAHDLHPDFYTTHLAEQLATQYAIPSMGVQHHHAHLAAVLAEYRFCKPMLGLVLDGYGYGMQNESWGGELLWLDESSFTRLGNLLPLQQPGGDSAAREPWRMAASVLHQLGYKEEIVKRFANQPHVHHLIPILDKKMSGSLTSSCGRLFDAAAALLNIVQKSHYEGEAAMRLESLVTKPEVLQNGWRIHNRQLDFLPTLEVISQISDPVLGANIFHGTLIQGLSNWVNEIAKEKKEDSVLLSGGCFANQILAEGICEALKQHHIRALLPKHLPPNDGGIALGQAWIAGNFRG